MRKQPDLEQLKLVMAEEHVSFEMLSKGTGIPVKKLIDLIEGEKEFRASEIIVVSKTLMLSDEQKIRIFAE